MIITTPAETLRTDRREMRHSAETSCAEEHRVAASPKPPDAAPTIRAANANLTISAETSLPQGRHGPLDIGEAVGRLFKTRDQGSGDSPPPVEVPASEQPARGRRRVAPAAISPVVDEPRPRNEFFADPDYDVVYAGRRTDDLLEWSMEVLLATGVDPMATVPAPYAPPPTWRSSRPGG